MTTSTAAVIVAHGDDRDMLSRCLDSVLDLPAIVVVTTGGSSWEAAAGRPRTRVLHIRNQGFGAGQNAGVALTVSETLLLLNPDAVIAEGAVAEGLRHLKRDRTLGAVQGVIRNREGRPDRSQGRLIRPIHLLGRSLGASVLLRLAPIRWIARRSRTISDHAERTPANPLEVEWLAATALLIKREAFNSVEGFHEGYFMYGEDQELSARLRQAGWKLRALPHEWATHEGGGSFQHSNTREIQWWRGTLLYAARCWGRAAWVLAALAIGVRTVRLLVEAPSEIPDFGRVLREALRMRPIGHAALAPLTPARTHP